MKPAAALLVAVATAVTGCGSGDDEPPPRRTTATDIQPRTDGDRAELARSQGDPQIETVATGLEAPWEIAFLPDGRALITERPGRVRLLSRRLKLRAEPVAEIEVAAVGEAGLLGVAIDPDFERNEIVYLYRTADTGNEVVRYRFRDNRLEDEKVIVDGIAAGAIHDGGRIHFGPDERLYFTSGEAGDDSLAQQGGSLNGKVLRMEPPAYRGDGGRPEVFSLGHRNPQGFDWEPRSERIVATEHGPDGDDEVNVLRRGGNYGWPDARGDDHDGFTAPVAVYEDSIAPSGATFVSLPGSEWTGDFLFGCLIGEQIRRVRLEGNRVTLDEPLFQGFGRVRTVVEGPDGALYALTSNRDGRGSPREGDDRLLRIVPPAD